MSAAAVSPQIFNFKAIGLPTQPVVATGLLLATAVVLVAFGSVVIQITHRAGLAKDADVLVRHARVECESHLLAGEREKCRQSLSVALLAR